MQEPWEKRLKEWSRRRNYLDVFLWGPSQSSKEKDIDEISEIESYTLRLSQPKMGTFAQMQIIRLLSVVFLALVWILKTYVNAKRSLFYISFWALSFTILG
jgi:hypothetical protein